MTLVLDTSGLLAALVADETHHEAAAAALRAEDGPLLLSPLVLAEFDYFLLTSRRGVAAELDFVTEVVNERYTLAPLDLDALAEARDVLARYHDLAIGLADASIVVLAARYGTRRLLTLDERHFRALRASDGSAFVLLPADA